MTSSFRINSTIISSLSINDLTLQALVQLKPILNKVQEGLKLGLD